MAFPAVDEPPTVALPRVEEAPTMAFPLVNEPPTTGLRTGGLASMGARPFGQPSMRQPSLGHAPLRPRGVRVGDAERDRACEVLATHFAAGRLTPAELDERTSRAVIATTQTELLRLTADLPGLGARPSHTHLGSPEHSYPYPDAAPRPLTQPLARPTPDTGRSAVMVLWGLITGAAAMCTMALLLGMAPTGEAGIVWLAAFGAAVSASGITYFVTRGSRPVPTAQPRRP